MKQINAKMFFSGLLILILSFQLLACRTNHDADIQTAISAATQTNPNLAQVSATVVNGVVTLTGQCPDEDSRKNAEKEIKKIDGVTHITNNIMIATATEVTPDDDLRKMSEKVVSKYKGVQSTVSEGIITLRGEVKKDKVQQLMMDLNSLHARRIDNQLAVK